jgi:flagellar biogenesis protein FliO
MAWIKQASVLVSSVLVANPATADEARANRPVTFVLPSPVVPEEPPIPGPAEPTTEASVPLVSEVLPTATTEASWIAGGASVFNVPEAPEVPAALPARNVPTLPARTSPTSEGETMSLANSALVRLAAATAGVLLLAVLVLSKLPKKVRQRAAAGPSGVVEIVARWPVAKGERLILVKFDRRMLLCHDAGQGWNRLCEVDDLTALARITETIEGKPDRDAFRQTLEAVATQGDSARARRPRTAALVETTTPSTDRSNRPKRGVVVDLTKGRRVRITA